MKMMTQILLDTNEKWLFGIQILTFLDHRVQEWGFSQQLPDFYLKYHEYSIPLQVDLYHL